MVYKYVCFLNNVFKKVTLTDVFGLPEINVPYLLVLDYPGWIPPYEVTPITGPYEYFDDYYRFGVPSDWYEFSLVSNNVISPGGLSWGPYP